MRARVYPVADLRPGAEFQVGERKYRQQQSGSDGGTSEIAHLPSL